MPATIGIRREDKNRWEARVPVVPEDVRALIAEHGLRFVVQPSSIRAFDDQAYRAAGATVSEDLGAAEIVVAVKEIPTALLRSDKTYVYFAHVIKGQAYNMAMLARLLELRATLIDYERIADAHGKRLVFFGRHAGNAGMIETLWALGQRLAAHGAVTPLAEVRHAYAYESLAAAQAHLRALGGSLARGVDGAPRPLVFGIAGYGNVSQGAQEVLDCLPVTEVAVADLAAVAASGRAAPPMIKVVFKEEHMARPREAGAPFVLRDYYDHPEGYAGDFARHLPHLDVLVNTIYWEPRYPRLVTKAWARQAYAVGGAARLQVIGDISCDVDGSIELTAKPTHPDEPCFVWDPETDTIAAGVAGRGPAIMAVDNLPCELPREASRDFSRALRPLLPALAAASWPATFAELELPPPLKNAVIVYRGALAPGYRYLEEHLAAARR